MVGICCGAGDYLVAAFGSALIFIVLLLFGRIRNDSRMLLIIARYAAMKKRSRR